MTDTTPVPPVIEKRKRRGLVDPYKVRVFSFSVITLCILISVFACILSIWDATGDATLWRTIATCIVIAGGMMAFGVVNALYGPQDH